MILTPISSISSWVSWIEQAYGLLTVAQGILLSVNISISLVSVLLLRNPHPSVAVALLLVEAMWS